MKKAVTFAMLFVSTLALADNTRALNPQPLPPGLKKVQKVALNPQPLPPGAKVQKTNLPAVQKHNTNK